jgi:hypothetical protein
MFSKDYLVRQLQQFVQALAMVILNKQQGQRDLAQGIIHNTMMDLLGVSLNDVRALNSEEMLGLVTVDGVLRQDLAIAAADLLAEDESIDGQLRAAWLFEAVLRSGGTVPHDVHQRIAELKAGMG